MIVQITLDEVRTHKPPYRIAGEHPDYARDWWTAAGLKLSEGQTYAIISGGMISSLWRYSTNPKNCQLLAIVKG
jgi:hypothetical protein